MKKQNRKTMRQLQAPAMSRAKLDQLARLGPWDREKDWGPTPEMVARAAKNRPFWANWESEALQSIEEIYRAFVLRVCSSLAIGFNPERTPGHANPTLSEDDREVYEHFVAWLEEMRHAGLKTYVPMVRDVVVLEEGCREPGIFRRAVNLHVAVRRKS